MGNAKPTEIPPDSLVGKYLPADYTDAFSREATTGRSFTADDVMVGFWAGQTGWVAALFRLRHFLVRFLGLQGDGGTDPDAFEKAIREGGSYRFAAVSAKNDHETVLLLSDKHLDAWLSVYVAGGGAHKTIFAITVVKFNNRLGRIYFFVIRPFHKIVVKNLLKKAIVSYE